jgi:hypothetical protein
LTLRSGHPARVFFLRKHFDFFFPSSAVPVFFFFSSPPVHITCPFTLRGVARAETFSIPSNADFLFSSTFFFWAPCPVARNREQNTTTILPAQSIFYAP